MFGWLPGADIDSIAEREVKDLNSTRTGSADRVGAWNWQDDFGAWLAGTNKDEVLSLATQKANNALLEKYQPQLDALKATLGPLAPSITDIAGKSEAQIKQLLEQDKGRAEALQTALTNPDFDVTALDPNASAGAIVGASNNATTQYNRGKQSDAEDKADKRYNDTQRLQIMQMQNQQAATQADREIRRDQQRLESKRLDMQDARAERRDRKDSISQMMAGLAQLGASLAI